MHYFDQCHGCFDRPLIAPEYVTPQEVEQLQEIIHQRCIEELRTQRYWTTDGTPAFVPAFPALLALEEHTRHAFAMPLLWLQSRLIQRKDVVSDGTRRRILAKYGSEWREAQEEMRRTLVVMAAEGGCDVQQTEMFVMWDFGWKYAERCLNGALASRGNSNSSENGRGKIRTVKRIKTICEVDMFSRHKRRKMPAAEKDASMDEYNTPSTTAATVCM
jgi:hypothetical protein